MSATVPDSARRASRMGRRPKPRLFRIAISGMRSRMPMALVLAAISTTAPTTSTPTAMMRRMNVRKEPKKLMKNDFSVSADTCASELRKRSFTACMTPSTCSGASARIQTMPTPRSPPCDSIASSRYWRLNHRTSGLPLPSGIVPTILSVRFTGKIVPRSVISCPTCQPNLRIVCWPTMQPLRIFWKRSSARGSIL
jgi:hypothetical protein